jgi:LDH2 family malate/lactate/ureidoglycolate dehydrogenase
VDISASITTNGMTNRKHKAGEKYEHEVFIDSKGVPTNDPGVLFQQPPGTLLPVGGLSHGHKGYGLSLLVESLTAGMAGHGRADPKEGWGATVHITVYDLNAFGGTQDFLRQMDHVADRCRNNPPIDPKRPVRMPGEKGLHLLREQSALGVRLHDSIAPSLAELEQKYQVWLKDALVG